MTDAKIPSVEIPLLVAVMVEFFKDKTKKYNILYSHAKEQMSPKSILVYLSNIGITCDIDVIDEDILKEFIVSKEIPTIHNLLHVYANVLYYAKYGHILYDCVEQLYFSETKTSAFVKANQKIIDHHLAVLDSLMQFAVVSLNGEFVEILGENAGNTQANQVKITNEMRKRAGVVGLIDDNVYPEFGHPLLSLFSLKDFTLAFSEDIKPLTEQTYFSAYFEDYMFKGKNFFFYFNNPNNAFFGLITACYNVLAEDEGSDEFQQGAGLILGMDQMLTDIEALAETLPQQDNDS